MADSIDLTARGWLDRATKLGLVEVIDADSAPILRRALGRDVGSGDVVALRLAPATAHNVEREWLHFPLHRLARIAPLLVDLSSVRLPAATLAQLLRHLATNSGQDGRVCVVMGSLSRRAELYSLTRPPIAVFTSLADALQSLVFSAVLDGEGWALR